MSLLKKLIMLFSERELCPQCNEGFLREKSEIISMVPRLTANLESEYNMLILRIAVYVIIDL